MSDEIRGLTLYQPFASMVAMGLKTLETRAWRTDRVGTLYVHASRRWDDAVRRDCLRAGRVVAGSKLAPGSPQEAVAKLLWLDTLGCVVARCRLVGCDRVPDWGWKPGVDAPGWDFEFGDLSPGRHAWVLADVVPVLPPVPWRGARGLWPAPEGLIAAVEERIGARVEES